MPKIITYSSWPRRRRSFCYRIIKYSWALPAFQVHWGILVKVLFSLVVILFLFGRVALDFHFRQTEFWRFLNCCAEKCLKSQYLSFFSSNFYRNRFKVVLGQLFFSSHDNSKNIPNLYFLAPRAVFCSLRNSTDARVSILMH